MTKRSPVTVLVLTLITLGIYGLVWLVKTKTELNQRYAANIPTAWIMLVPFVGALYWQWRWSEGIEKATGTSAISVFLLMALIPVVGIPVVVGKLNDARPALPTAVASSVRLAA